VQAVLAPALAKRPPSHESQPVLPLAIANVPEEQSVQTDAPAAEKAPPEHSWHNRAAAALANVPDRHAWHARRSNLVKLPGWQRVHVTAPESRSVKPFSQDRQADIPGSGACVLGGQTVQAVAPYPPATRPAMQDSHPVPLGTGRNSPGAHNVQTELPGLDENRPASQVSHVVPPKTDEYCPAAHASQLVDPEIGAILPGAQTKQAHGCEKMQCQNRMAHYNTIFARMQQVFRERLLAIEIEMAEAQNVLDRLDSCERMTALAMGQHDRLGGDSPLLDLPEDLLRLISDQACEI